MTVNIFTLIARTTADTFLQLGLEVAQALGLPTTTWRTGDPTRSNFKFLAEALETQDELASVYIAAGFLTTAVADANTSSDSSWLKVLALEVFGVEVTEATFATSQAGEGVTLSNSGGGLYPVTEVGQLTFRASSSGKTFHNTTTGTLASGPGTTLLLEFIADEAGSDSSVGVDEIDELVTTLLGVTVTASDPAIATDEQTPDEIAEQCRSTLGALSPSGPADAYEYVVRNPDLTGVTDITRATTVDDSATGEVTVYVASPTGAVASPSIVAAQAAVEQWATPLCITPTVVNATGVTIAVTATVTGNDLPADFADTIEGALGELFAALAIGDDVSTSIIIATIHAAVPAITSTTLTLPAAAVPIDPNEVPVLGVVTITEV